MGLEIDGFKDVFVHSLSPDLLEKLGLRIADGKLEVPVVKEIPAEIVGQGAGGGALFGNWHIQTCFPPDIKKYGLDELRFGDLVLLKDTQTDYGRGYYKGGATVGVVCGGPSDISGLGIGVTADPVDRFGKIAGTDRSRGEHRQISRPAPVEQGRLRPSRLRRPRRRPRPARPSPA